MKKLVIIGILLVVTSSFGMAQDIEKVSNVEMSSFSSISKFMSYDFGNYTVKVFLKDNKSGT